MFAFGVDRIGCLKKSALASPAKAKRVTGFAVRGTMYDNIVMATKKSLGRQLPLYIDTQNRRVGANVFKDGRLWGRTLLAHGVGVRNEADGLQGGGDFRVGHEVFPDEARPVVLDHDNDLRLIESHPNGLEPVLRLIETIEKAIGAPRL